MQMLLRSQPEESSAKKQRAKANAKVFSRDLRLPRGVHRAGWKLAYRTKLGRSVLGDSAAFLSDPQLGSLHGAAQLVFTSPPFPLRTKKSYGNLTGEEYTEWLAEFGALFKKWLAPTGSVVIELGNAWERGQPTMSTLPTKALLRFQEANGLHLCQEFICHNPARLPTPAEWVTVRRVRVKDSFTRVWWMAATPHPKANNREVLQEYSTDMLRLLATRKYSAGRRPSEHYIGKKSFLADNGGAIPPSVLTIANTRTSDEYQKFCAKHGHTLHPARMPRELAEFFIRFLTSPGDRAAAERLGRRWLSIEAESAYLAGSRGRFLRRKDAP
jgi:DNA modification methylase